MTTIGERFAYFMDFYGLSREEIEVAAGIHHTNVSKIVKNKIPVTRKLQDKIAEAFPQLSIDWLIYGRGDMIRKEPIPEGIGLLLKSMADFLALDEKDKSVVTEYLKQNFG